MSDKIVCGGFEFEKGGFYTSFYSFICVIGVKIIEDEEFVHINNGDNDPNNFASPIDFFETGLPGCSKITKVKRVLGKDDVGKVFKFKSHGNILWGPCLESSIDSELCLGINDGEVHNPEIICEMVEGEKW